MNTKSTKSVKNTITDTELTNKTLMSLQAKSEELKNEELNRIMDFYKEKENFEGLKEKITYIFGRNDARIIFDSIFQVL